MVSCFVFLLFIFSINIERIADYDDMAFDIINMIDSNVSYKSGNKILVFEIDDKFLKKNKLMDSNGRLNKNYNDLFPREHLIKFIEKIDKVEPRLLFIDLDLDNREQNNEDRQLISLLRKKRNYPIFLTHNSNENFIEREKIEGIYFVSTKFEKNFDNKVRKYYSFSISPKENNEQVRYYFAALVFSGNTSDIKDDHDVVRNRFIFKERFLDSDSIVKSYWKDINYYSLNKEPLSLKRDHTKDSIIFLGINHSDTTNNDSYHVYNGYKASGIELIANSLANIYYFSPRIEPLPIAASFIIIFLVTFLARYMSLITFNRKESIIFFVFIAIFANLIISYFFLKYSSYWFNYFTPYVIYIAYEILVIIGSTIYFIKTLYFKLRKLKI